MLLQQVRVVELCRTLVASEGSLGACGWKININIVWSKIQTLEKGWSGTLEPGGLCMMG